jgi:hypothetical protein
MRFNFLALAALSCSLAATAFYGTVCRGQEDQRPVANAQFPEQAPAAQSKEQLEKKFAEMLSGATLKGYYTTGRDNNGPPKEDKYSIESVTKLSGDLFLFRVKIQYAGQNTVVPLPLRVLWAGDTPVITLDKLSIPGFGTFTARVMFFDGQYLGTWDGDNHGGMMYGTYSKEASKDASARPASSGNSATPK